MQLFSICAMDEYVVGTTQVSTSSDVNDQLGSADKLAVQVVADNVRGSSVTLTVIFESSSDGRNWFPRPVPLVNAVSLSTGVVNVVHAFNTGSTPVQRLVRFRMGLAGTGPSAHLKIHVTGRGGGDATTEGPTSSPAKGLVWRYPTRSPLERRFAIDFRSLEWCLTLAVTIALPARAPRTAVPQRRVEK